MSIGITDSNTSDIGGGGVQNSQGRDVKDAAAKGGMSVLGLTGNMEVGKSTGGTSWDGDVKRKGGTEVAAQFSARSVGGQTTTGERGGFKYQIVTGIRQGPRRLGITVLNGTAK